MKLPEVIDRRLSFQLVCLGLFMLLPIYMIAVNGMQAMHGILYSKHQVPLVRAAVESSMPLRLETLSTSSKSNVDDSQSVAPVQEMENEQQLKFGVFDPEDVFANERSLKLRHVYVSWAAFDEHQLTSKLKDLERRGYQVFLTVEPWPVSGETRETLLTSIAAGKYDATIDRLCGVLSSISGPAYVSWGHEMDQDLTERYPWSAAEPTAFIRAYKHVIDRIRSRVTTKISWVWAGVLKEGSLRYWPGREYADYVGMPIYCYSNWDQKRYGYIRDFPTDFDEKQKIVDHLEMPIIITELGVSGSPDFGNFWLHQAFKRFKDYPSLKAVLFFYARDTDGAWGQDVATPDWRVHPDSIRGLVNWSISTRQ